MKTEHRMPTMGKDEWLTPPWIMAELGEFDLDPCSPVNRPWDTGKAHYTLFDNGLNKEWKGRVWCNPPYGREAEKWMARMADHGNGILMLMARTETKAFFDHVWDKAHSILFMKGRVNFCHVNGTMAKGNAGAPSCLISYDAKSSHILLCASKIEGKFIRLQE